MWFISLLFEIFLTVTLITSEFVKDDLLSSILRSNKEFDANNEETVGYNNNRQHKDAEVAKQKAEVLKKVKIYEKQLDALQDLDSVNQRYQRDPVLNFIGRRWNRDKRSKKKPDTSYSSSSSIELKKWKDEWKDLWMQKKLEAINSSVPKGDTVNMVAARPWGVPCGDPNQHDAPWGTCMLPMECEAEYRIYRGDYFCGRTKFICCALQITNYDLYAGFDVSFADSSLATDTEEKNNRVRGSKERKRRKKIRDKKRRLRERVKRKRKIKRTIQKIIREIRIILNRSYKNGTTSRKRKTKQLKKFIKSLKNKYITDRKAVKDIHEMELIKIDAALMKRLNEIRGMNQQYVRNATFRAMIANGTISKQNARMLIKAYPELADMLQTRRRGRSRGDRRKDYLDYDIEYGYLYY
ncbi:unnamed protein product, partial [Brenthis ino]